MRVAGVEADDVIGTVATRAHEEGFVVAIASPDKVPQADSACLSCAHTRHMRALSSRLPVLTIISGLTFA